MSGGDPGSSHDLCKLIHFLGSLDNTVGKSGDAEQSRDSGTVSGLRIQSDVYPALVQGLTSGLHSRATSGVATNSCLAPSEQTEGLMGIKATSHPYRSND